MPDGVGELQMGSKVYFGPDLAPINGKPAGYVADSLIANVEWMTRALDAAGYRLDHVQGISAEFLRRLLSEEITQGKFAVGEFWDGTQARSTIGSCPPRGWPADAAHSTFRFISSFWPCRTTRRSTWRGSTTPALRASIPCARSRSSRTTTPVATRPCPQEYPAGQQASRIRLHPDLGRDCPASSTRTSVSHRAVSASCSDLSSRIHLDLPEHRRGTDGATLEKLRRLRFRANWGSAAPRRPEQGQGDVAAPVQDCHGIGPNWTLHDYTGHEADLVTDSEGRSRPCHPVEPVRTGLRLLLVAGLQDAFALTPRDATQVFEGAADLDIMPARSGDTASIARIHCEAGAPVEGQLSFDARNWDSGHRADPRTPRAGRRGDRHQDLSAGGQRRCVDGQGGCRRFSCVDD